MRLSSALLGALIFVDVFAHAQATADVLLQRGIALAKAGKLHEAAAALNEGRRFFPRDARFPVELAGVAYREKNIPKAKRLLKNGLELSPSDQYANDFLGTLFQLDGNLPAAMRYWNRIGKPFLGGVIFQPDPGISPILRDRLFDFSAGQVLTNARLATAYANAQRTDLLASVRIDLVGTANAQYNAIVEAQPIAIPLSGWIGHVVPVLRDVPYQGVDLDFYDIHGNGANFTSLWRWDANKRRIAVQLAAPVHGNPRIERTLWLDARNEIWNLQSHLVTLRRAAAGFNFKIGVTPKLEWNVGASGSYRALHNRPDQATVFQNGALFSIDDRLDYALWRMPERRISVSSWGEFNAGRVVGAASSRLVVGRGGFSAEWFPQAKDDIYRVSAQVQAGGIAGSAPLDELFMLAMDRDTKGDLWIRGLPAYVKGQKGNGLLGSRYAISQTTLERRFFQLPLVTITAGPFFDAGWVRNDVSRYFNAGSNESVGLQARVKTIGAVTLTAIYGRDLTTGRSTFFTAVSR